jgi:hypothetical protein
MLPAMGESNAKINSAINLEDEEKTGALRLLMFMR